MKIKTLVIISILVIPFFVLGQKTKTPKNLKKAILYLNQTTSDSIKNLISNYGNDSLKQISYPWGGKFKTVYNWTDRDNFDSKIIKYLDKKGVSFHQTEVIFIAFKEFLNNNEFNEKAILHPFQILELKWEEEDKVRYSTDTLRGNYIPKDLNDCFKQIDKLWNDSIKLEVKNWTEDEFTVKTHFGFGRWIRNNWQLWAGSRLSKYFKEKGIFHPDSMSGIILDSYHRYLNKKEIQIEKQITFHKDFWDQSEKEAIKREKEDLEESQLYFDEYQIGDTLEFNYNYDFATKAQKDKWMDDICLARGILLEKNKTKLKLKVKVIQSCDKKGIVYYSNENTRIYDKKKKKWVRPKKMIRKFIKKGKTRWFKLDDWELE